jgi:cytochrome c oxidase cbb3-type subunit I
MAPSNDMKSEFTPSDSASRYPLLLLLFSGLLWLVVSGVLGVLASVQLHDPIFLSGHAFLTYGRRSVLAKTAFVYGWLANAGLGVSLWMLGRLAGEPLRGQNWAIWGAVFWNLGVTGALVGVASGYATGFALLGLPASVQLLLLFSYAAIAVPGLLAWSGRLREVSFASHWYAAAALFVFPWILSIAHVMLFTAPVRGVLQPIVAGWYAQAAWTLWLAPLALSAAYYVVPKVTGKILPSYEFASLGFWCLIFVGGLTGGRHLLGGPVPAWIPSVAVVACALLLFHTCIVLLNLKGAFSGKGTALKFIAFGLAAYAVGALVDTATSFHAVAVHTQFTYFDEAQKQVALYAAASMILFGGIYFALPRITGKAWYSGWLVRIHLILSVAGLILFIGGLAMASVVQSQDLLEASVPFADISHHTRPWIQAATAGRAVLLFANVAFLVNFYLTACMILKISKPAAFEPSSAMETPAS